MKIQNTIPYFLENFVPTESFLKHYYETFPTSFQEYFLYHCKNVEEKMKFAIEKYPTKLKDIKDINEKIEHLIHQVVALYEKKYHVKFTKDVHIIVGAYGSNAFTHRQIIPEITFCVERLSAKDEHLQVIIAHEFGHALHNILSDQAGMDWTNVQWNHPYIWLFQEGCATYFSTQVVDVDEAVYFSYDDGGEEWLQFAKENKVNIISLFLEDLNKQDANQIFREWFSINGGTHFGYTRLGYYIGYCVVAKLLEKYYEKEAITIWKESYFFDEVHRVLMELEKQ